MLLSAHTIPILPPDKRQSEMRFPAEKDLLVSMLASTILRQLPFYFRGMCRTVRLMHTVNRTNTFYIHAVSGPFSSI